MQEPARVLHQSFVHKYHHFNGIPHFEHLYINKHKHKYPNTNPNSNMSHLPRLKLP